MDLGWSLGYMINATNRIPVESSCMEIPDSVYFGVLAVLLLVFILGVICVIAGCLLKRKDAGPTSYDSVDKGYGGV